MPAGDSAEAVRNAQLRERLVERHVLAEEAVRPARVERRRDRPALERGRQTGDREQRRARLPGRGALRPVHAGRVGDEVPRPARGDAERGRVTEREIDRPVAAHRDACDRTRAAAVLRRVGGVDRLDEVARDERAPAGARIGDGVVPLGVAVGPWPSTGRHDDHRRRDAPVDQAVQPILHTEREEAVGRSRRAVEEVERGQARPAGPVGRREVDEGAHGLRQRSRPDRAHDDRTLRRRCRGAERAAHQDGNHQHEHERRDADGTAHGGHDGAPT